VATVTKESASGVRSEAGYVRALYLVSQGQPQVTRRRRLYGAAKRALDLVSATLLLIVLSPLMLVIAIIIKATSSGPAILVQERVGRGGRVFSFFKFRSMYSHIDRSADVRFARDYINGSHVPKAQGGVFKPANEQWITPVGRFLRKASLDELPQLFNILRGDMSLVGPRPSMPYEVDVYKPWHFRRLEVLPGLTGLPQIRGRSSLTFNEIVQIDVEYIERSSLWLDLQILLLTVPVVLSGRGAR